MTTELFCFRGTTASKKPRLYEMCGLDNIWLVDGFEIVEHDGEELVQPEDVEGLHKAIALHLARFKKALTGREIRFIRRALDMTQGELAWNLGTGVQTVARWEKDKVSIPGPEDRLLRMTTIVAASNADRLAQLLTEMPRNLEDLDEAPARPVRFKHDRIWTEDAKEAA